MPDMAEGDIAGLKLIRHNAGQINEPDDETLPFKMEANFRPPEFMSFTFVCLYGGSEELIVRSETLEALEEFIRRNDFRTHPRLRRLIITGPNGYEERFER